MLGASTVSSYLVTSNGYFSAIDEVERKDMKVFCLRCVRYGDGVNQALKIVGY
jgi:hypothetical protein